MNSFIRSEQAVEAQQRIDDRAQLSKKVSRFAISLAAAAGLLIGGSDTIVDELNPEYGITKIETLALSGSLFTAGVAVSAFERRRANRKLDEIFIEFASDRAPDAEEYELLRMLYPDIYTRPEAPNPEDYTLKDAIRATGYKKDYYFDTTGEPTYLQDTSVKGSIKGERRKSVRFSSPGVGELSALYASAYVSGNVLGTLSPEISQYPDLTSFGLVALAVGTATVKSSTTKRAELYRQGIDYIDSESNTNNRSRADTETFEE